MSASLPQKMARERLQPQTEGRMHYDKSTSSDAGASPAA